LEYFEKSMAADKLSLGEAKARLKQAEDCLRKMEAYIVLQQKEVLQHLVHHRKVSKCGRK
jgi:hypothetical protein